MAPSPNLVGAAADVATWLSSTGFATGYIFGSLVHKSGAQFDPQLSDVDVICTFPDSQLCLDRWRTLNAAEPLALDLNLALIKRFGRNDASKPIASLVPVTSFELSNGLHKDKSPQFFSHNNFYSVTDKAVSFIGAEHAPCNADLEGVLDAVREAQRCRNKYLAVSANGARALSCYDGPDVLPKDFMRVAAQVRWAYDSKAAPEDRFDVNEGLVYAMQLLLARRHEAAEVNDLLQRFVVRMGGRGQPSLLSSDDQMLLWEILADEAIGIFSRREGATPTSPKQPSRPRTSEATRQEVFKAAQYRCCFPGCDVPLPPDGIGELAHITSITPLGPRFDPKLSDNERNTAKNFVLLCPTHHRLVDSQPDVYDAEQLRAWRVTSDPSKSAKIEAMLSSKNLFTLMRFMLDLLV